MISRRHFSQLMLSASALPFIAPIAVRAQQDEPRRGGTLVYALNQAPPSLISLVSPGVERGISAKVVEGLLDYDHDLNPRPQLATEWDISEDGLTYRFKLREGVTFHDGTPFTSRDVEASIRIVSQNHSRGRASFANLESIETPSDHEVVLRLSKPAPYLLRALPADEVPIVPAHLFGEGDPTGNPALTAPVGTGPFRFIEYVRGSHVLLERNEDYWQAGKPYLDSVIIRFITDGAARTAAFETGEVHIGGGASVPLSDLGRLIDENPHLALETRGQVYDAGVNRIEFNLENEILANRNVRLAIAHLIDKDYIRDTIYYGYGAVIDGPFAPEVPYYTPGLPHYEVDVDLANRLLDEAGYPRDANGVRFQIRIDPRPLADTDRPTAEYLRARLAEVGIEATLRTQDFAAYVNRVFTERDFDIIVNGITNSFDPTIGTQRIYWSENLRRGVPFSNATAYNNPEVDRLLLAAAVEIDPKTRFQQFADFQRQVVNDLPDIHTVSQFRYTLYNTRVQNHTVGATGINGNFADIWLAD
ncbi:ABC transporter substrate-binding protein [Devosia epidermidihirudinis]|uniref:ABC transporter substrate-binding protein n=1 Tax=Devosia epidermidihirudinis TaxID=1293439 RepID=A0A0F5QDA2_9HYPH|nr:ABC transporter substrate-binding protein [Devosia epidermidihirudinis]KKC37984.1 ABC transporter substrate-binding protein [Devosia epidermidihirudinis]